MCQWQLKTAHFGQLKTAHFRGRRRNGVDCVRTTGTVVEDRMRHNGTRIANSCRSESGSVLWQDRDGQSAYGSRSGADIALRCARTAWLGSQRLA